MSQENVEIVRRMWAGLNENDLRLDLYDEEIEIRNPAACRVTGPFRGLDGVRQWGVEIWEVFSEIRHEVEEIVEAGDGQTLMSVQRTFGRMRHTGIDVNLRWATVWTIRGGTVWRADRYLTKAEALEAVGLRE